MKQRKYVTWRHLKKGERIEVGDQAECMGEWTFSCCHGEKYDPDGSHPTHRRKMITYKTQREQLFMKKDVRELLKQFTTTGFQNGDLILTAEIHRVTNVDWDKREEWDEPSDSIEVATVWPVCELCSKQGIECCHHHILRISPAGGQHAAMKFKI